jgi:hypothetical protein
MIMIVNHDAHKEVILKSVPKQSSTEKKNIQRLAISCITNICVNLSISTDFLLIGVFVPANRSKHCVDMALTINYPFCK